MCQGYFFKWSFCVCMNECVRTSRAISFAWTRRQKYVGTLTWLSVDSILFIQGSLLSAPKSIGQSLCTLKTLGFEVKRWIWKNSEEFQLLFTGIYFKIVKIKKWLLLARCFKRWIPLRPGLSLGFERLKPTWRPVSSLWEKIKLFWSR